MASSSPAWRNPSAIGWTPSTTVDPQVTWPLENHATLPSGATASSVAASASFWAAPPPSGTCRSWPLGPITTRPEPSVDQWIGAEPTGAIARGLRIGVGGGALGLTLGVGVGTGPVLNVTGLILATGWPWAVEAAVTVIWYCVFPCSPCSGVMVSVWCCESHCSDLSIAGWTCTWTVSVLIGWLNRSRMGFEVGTSCAFSCGLTTWTLIRSDSCGPSVNRNATVTISTAPIAAPAHAMGCGASSRRYHGTGGRVARSQASRISRRRRICRNWGLGSTWAYWCGAARR